jgi:hypothetical protein
MCPLALQQNRSLQQALEREQRAAARFKAQAPREDDEEEAAEAAESSTASRALATPPAEDLKENFKGRGLLPK